MSTFRSIYRQLDLLQQQMFFRLLATALALAVCGGYFGTLIVTSYSLDRQRQTLQAALETQSLATGDRHATSLSQAGTVTVDGRTYQLKRLADRPSEIFDEDGHIAAVPFVVEDLLHDQIPAWAPTWLLDQPQTTWLLTIVFTVWLVLVVWLSITVPFLLTLIGTLLPASFFWYFGWEQAMVAVLGIGLLTFTFVLLSRALLFAFDRPNQICAVAHTVIKEASRRRLSLGFIVVLLVALPLLPLWLDPEAPLRYQIQTFISRGISLTFVIAACMTLLLSCATIAFEIRDRQIWQLVTKPLNKFNYLLGKWIGVVSVNVIILIVSGISIFTFIQYLRTQPVAPGIEGQIDFVQVEHEVLTARRGTQPIYEQLHPEQVRERLHQQIENDPELSAANISLAERQRIADEIQNQYLARQRSIPPMSHRSYVFTGLDQAREYGVPLTLRYRFYIRESDTHSTFQARFIFNQDIQHRRDVTYVPALPHVLMIGPDMVREDGTLIVTIANMYDPPPGLQGSGSISFDEKDFELMYKVANFEGNFLRAMLMLWVKLAFLAMLGICCATFLSFSVACLLSFTIFLAGSMAPYLATSLQYYYTIPTAAVDFSNVGMVIQWAFQSVIRLIAEGLVFALEAFGTYRPTQALVEGRAIAWGGVGVAFATIGLFWSGVALVISYLVLRSRQLAIYSGQG